MAECQLRCLGEPEIEAHLESLCALLTDAVEGGASVGFLPPLAPETARAYWQDVRRAVAAGHRILVAALESAAVVGTVQLELPAMPNAGHRAEVMKLMVDRRVRGRGLGARLMRELEAHAREAGRTLLVLDTRVGDTAEQLYLKLGYTAAGVVPGYARSASGELDGTVIMYRRLE